VVIGAKETRDSRRIVAPPPKSGSVPLPGQPPPISISTAVSGCETHARIQRSLRSLNAKQLGSIMLTSPWHNLTRHSPHDPEAQEYGSGNPAARPASSTVCPEAAVVDPRAGPSEARPPNATAANVAQYNLCEPERLARWPEAVWITFSRLCLAVEFGTGCAFLAAAKGAADPLTKTQVAPLAQ
jgi:hypothetical protein